MSITIHLKSFVLAAAASSVAASAFAQSAQPTVPTISTTVTVTARKEPEDINRIPMSVTAVTKGTLEVAGVRTVSEAAAYAPNVYFAEFTARKLSNPRFRGVGSSPNNPAITTFIDGVPQLNANSSSIELADIEQIEFIRGPQSALYGRNTIGGLVSIVSARPLLDRWTGSLSVPFGNLGSRDVRGIVSGPIIGDRLSISAAAGHARRDGFTVNDLTGNDLDYRSAGFGKGQLLWKPNSSWETRVIVSGERARDGDYALNDLASLRVRPFHAARDFEGHTDRDVVATTAVNRATTGSLTFSSTTGIVRWNTDDLTDLDYTPLPLITRSNTERELQFTQEFRVASSGSRWRWQSGLFLFTQNYEQDAINNFAPFLLSPQLSFPVSQHSPLATLDDVGVGVYGQATASVNDRLELTFGARADHESKEADLNTFFVPAIFPGSPVAAKESFSDVSPQFALAYRPRPDNTIYVTTGRGFKSGGFNASSPTGSEAYGQEHTWQFEAGSRHVAANGRVTASVGVFYTRWDDLQLNEPHPFIPASFYISNVGRAASRGVEADLSLKPTSAVNVFASFGYTNARFDQGVTSSGVNVGGKKLPFTPDVTASFGAQYTRALTQAASIYGRGEVATTGKFAYDDTNMQFQDTYALTNLRVGVRGRFVFAEAWVRNAFDTRYIPMAFPYPNFAASGFVGESGAPRTFGVTGGVTF